jgi:para-nitrobenzyl esterase
MSPETESPRVTLPHGGRLRGAWAQGVRVFRGVRYAKAPVGERRFAAPVPEAPWSGERDAVDTAPMAPQLSRQARPGDAALGDADCLRVNIWAPPQSPGASWPVMVWVHGGGFFRGSASEPLYDGASFARQGVVLVSLQYRLGVDGFLHFEGDGVGAGGDAPWPANRGLLDQLAALRWVKENIAAWGGDAGRITVFGQSAGAGALACLLGMPETEGLFQRAILQSPSIACQSLTEAATVRRAIAHLVGVAPEGTSWAEVPTPQLLHAVHRLAAEPALRLQHGLGQKNFFPLRPVVDGHILVAPPLQALKARWSTQAPNLQLLVGCNAQEMRLYHVPGGAIDRVTEDEVERFASDVGLPSGAVDCVRTCLPAAQRSPGEVLSALQSDYYYRIPSLRIADLAARHCTSAHRYEFQWASPQWHGRLGAAHGVELPFVFGNLHTAQGAEFTGPHPPAHLAQAMHQNWARFAATGEPGWRPYAASEPWVQTFGHELSSQVYREPDRFSVWEGLL